MPPAQAGGRNAPASEVASDVGLELPACPVIQITVTVVLPGRLAWLLAAAGAFLQVLWHGR